MDYELITKELEPFLEDGKVTKETKLKWLQFKGVASIHGNEFKVRPDDTHAEKLTFKKYEEVEKTLERYFYKKYENKVGQMGVKQPISSEINPEEIPF